MNKRKKSVIENRRNSSPLPQKRESSNQKKISQSVVRPPVSLKNNKKTKRKGGFKKFFKTIVIIAFIFVGTCFGVNAFFLGSVDDLPGNLSNYGISSEAATMAKQHKIVNVAVFGVDGRDDVQGNRTDTIMIASADYEHSKIKVTSLMRDTYVYVNDQYGYDKINAAYSYGGPTLAMQTINQNYDTAITDYVTIDFTAMVFMVNAVGGITIDIESQDELDWVNEYLIDVNDKVNTASPPLKNTGSQVVDGSQALAYCRVRYVGDGDFDRTLRQRTVFEQVLSKAFDLNLIDQYKLLMGTLPYIKTSLTTPELIKYAANLALMPNKNIEQNRLPTDDANALENIDGVSYVIPNTLVDNIKAFYSFIYETNYTPSTTANNISKKIAVTLKSSSN
ncbi:LCP family protein [Acetobacterium tundrae]|uniref:LytR family transcriptional regulator n=1 Tax=Acetobacterium tundrae TaxID=132932 RepID=A0ABR6WHK7_9FIRM|nr:LCP family protein [Acetobacterium tundrae]MBC3795959.1 LytR family transcriptional regulator [Acetobacterium tundrae]